MVRSIASFARSACWAAVIGAGGSVVVNTVRRDPERAKRLLAYSAVSGLTGLSIGCTYAIYKKRNTFTYAVDSSTSFFLVSGTFFVIRDNLLVSSKAHELRTMWDQWQGKPSVFERKEAMSRMSASALSGGATGFLLSCVVWRGTNIVFGNILQGVLLGIGGQWSVNKCRVWILEETIKYHYPELVAAAKANDETWEQKGIRLLSGRTHGSYVNEELRGYELQLEILEEEETKLLQILEALEKNSDVEEKEE